MHTGLLSAIKGILWMLFLFSPTGIFVLGVAIMATVPQEWVDAASQAVYLSLSKPVDLRVPSLIVSTMLLGVGLAQLYQKRVIIGLLTLTLIVDVFFAVHLSVTQEDEQLRIVSNAITAIFLGLSAYVVVTFKGGTINTYRLMWNERGRWKEIFHLFGFWVHRTCSPLAIMMIPIILLDRGLELLHLKVTRIRKESPRRRPPGLTWPPHHHKPSGLNWPHTS